MGGRAPACALPASAEGKSTTVVSRLSLNARVEEGRVQAEHATAHACPQKMGKIPKARRVREVAMLPAHAPCPVLSVKIGRGSPACAPFAPCAVGFVWFEQSARLDSMMESARIDGTDSKGTYQGRRDVSIMTGQVGHGQ